MCQLLCSRCGNIVIIIMKIQKGLFLDCTYIPVVFSNTTSIAAIIIDANLLIQHNSNKMLKHEFPRRKRKHHRKHPTTKTKFLLVVSEA